MTKLTLRQKHARQLQKINHLSGEYTSGSFYRAMSFDETRQFLEGYDHYIKEGYPKNVAEQYAWDMFFSAKRGQR